MTDDDMLNRIRTYRQSGYQISDDEANELNEIRLAAIDSSSKAGVLASDRVVLPGGTTLTEGTITKSAQFAEEFFQTYSGGCLL